jgi:hypothetical protein
LIFRAGASNGCVALGIIVYIAVPPFVFLVLNFRLWITLRLHL